MMALRMNPDFDVILGSDWYQQNKADIMFSIDRLHIGRAATDGSEHWWHVSKRGVEHSVKCKMIAAADLNKGLSCDDKMFMLTVNAVAESAQYGDISISADIERDVKGKWADVFKDQPAELPPEKSAFHTIPLKENESAPKPSVTDRLLKRYEFDVRMPISLIYGPSVTQLASSKPQSAPRWSGRASNPVKPYWEVPSAAPGGSQ